MPHTYRHVKTAAPRPPETCPRRRVFTRFYYTSTTIRVARARKKMNAAIFHRRSTRLSTGWTRKKNPGTIKNAACVTDKPTRVVRFFSAPPRIMHAADDSIFRAKCFFSAQRIFKTAIQRTRRPFVIPWFRRRNLGLFCAPCSQPGRRLCVFYYKALHKLTIIMFFWPASTKPWPLNIEVFLNKAINWSQQASRL